MALPSKPYPGMYQEMVRQMQVWRLKVLLHEAFGTSPMPSSLLREHWLGLAPGLSLVPPLEPRSYQDRVPLSAASSAVSQVVSLAVPAVKLSNTQVKTPSV